MLALYRIGDVGIVSSLHDGMNLVAKEYVSSRSDNGGMLVLSQFTGASRELTDAVLINPYDRNQFSDGIYTALTLAEEDRQGRMMRMREIIQHNNIFRWAGKIISDLLKFKFKDDEIKYKMSDPAESFRLSYPADHSKNQRAKDS